MESLPKELGNAIYQGKPAETDDNDDTTQSSTISHNYELTNTKDEAKCLAKADNLVMAENESNNLGLFAYVPKYWQRVFLKPYSLLFFLCWASTMQVNSNVMKN